MSYKFVKITTYYPAYLNDYYSRFPNITDKSYVEQYDHLMADAFGWADFFSKNLRKFGVNAHEIVFNAEPLQSAWAREHSLKIRGKELLIAQLKTLRPSIVFVEDSKIFNKAELHNLRTQIPSINKLVGWHCFEYNRENIEHFKTFDLLVNGNPKYSTNFFINLGIQVYQFHLAFEDSLLPFIFENNEYPETDVIFMGSLIPRKGFFSRRIELLEGLLEKGIPIKIYGNLIVNEKDTYLRTLAKQSVYGASIMFEKLGLGTLNSSSNVLQKAVKWGEKRNAYSKRLQNVVCPALYGLEMMRLLSKAKIAVNIHIDLSKKYGGNMRLFETTGVGTCLVTDIKDNLNQFFTVDREVVAYRSVEECAEKINWLLEHPSERKKIANAGQKRTLRDHTYAQRIAQLNEAFLNLLRS